MSLIADNSAFSDQVASLCYKHFDNLAKKGKPVLLKEWSILAAVVLRLETEENVDLQVVSMGTGSKCVGQGQLSASGDLINDRYKCIMRTQLYFYLINLKLLLPMNEAMLKSLQGGACFVTSTTSFKTAMPANPAPFFFWIPQPKSASLKKEFLLCSLPATLRVVMHPSYP